MLRAQLRLKKKHENNVGLFNDWLGRSGHPVIAVWVVETEESTGKLSRVLEPVLDADGVPVLVSPAAILEYLMKMAHGDAQSVPKGGEPEYRNGEQYGKQVGIRQGDRMAKHEKQSKEQRWVIGGKMNKGGEGVLSGRVKG